MSKPKFDWQEKQAGDRFLRGTYGSVEMRVYEERKPVPAAGETKAVSGKFRIRCHRPKFVKLSSPVTFKTEKEAKNKAEAEAKRIHNNLPPVDHKALHRLSAQAEEQNNAVQLLTKTGLGLIDAVKQFVQIVTLLAAIGLEPIQAACEAIKLRKMTGGREPEELIGLYLDYFVRIRGEPMLIELAVNKMIEQIQKSDLCEHEKKARIRMFRKFAEDRKGRTMDSLTVEELKLWRLNLTCGCKGKYDTWIVMRQLIADAYKDYGTITKHVYERIMELNYTAKAGTLFSTMPVRVWQEIFRRCACANDVLYLALLSDVPIRDKELRLVNWEDITLWHGIPKWILVPRENAKGKKDKKNWRQVRVPRRLGKLLLKHWRNSGPLIVGKGQLERLKLIALQIDPGLDWEHNLLRRSCISYYVAAYSRPEFMASQAGHTSKVQRKRYLRTVNPLDARKYVLFDYLFPGIEKLPFEFPGAVKGRPKETDSAPPLTETTATRSGSEPLLEGKPSVASAAKAENEIKVPAESGPFKSSVETCQQAAELPAAPCTPPEGTPAKVDSEPPVTTPRLQEGQMDTEVTNGTAKADSGANQPPPKSKIVRRRKGRFPRPSKLKLFEMLWTMPATQVAETICDKNGKHCSQELILFWAKDWDFQGPGYGYWQKVKNQIRPEVPASAKAMYLKLRAEHPNLEELGEIPNVFKDAPESPTGSQVSESGRTLENVNPPDPDSTGQNSISGKRRTKRRRFVLTLSKADFLEQLWLGPATRIADKCGGCNDTILKVAHELGLPTPPAEYWQNRKNGDPIVIPAEILTEIARLRAEPHA